MGKTKRRLGAVLATVVATGALAPAALAHPDEEPPPPEEPPGKCNAGNGNGSDAITWEEGAHCFGGDPGNSYNAGNRGGDEIPDSDGVPNPGGNNHPGP